MYCSIKYFFIKQRQAKTDSILNNRTLKRSWTGTRNLEEKIQHKLHGMCVFRLIWLKSALITDVTRRWRQNLMQWHNCIIFYYVIQHFFICCPSDFTVSVDVGIEPRPVATFALKARHCNQKPARSHPHCIIACIRFVIFNILPPQIFNISRNDAVIVINIRDTSS